MCQQKNIQKTCVGTPGKPPANSPQTNPNLNMCCARLRYLGGCLTQTSEQDAYINTNGNNKLSPESWQTPAKNKHGN